MTASGGTDGCAVVRPTHPEVASLARKVDSKRWYQDLSSTGLNYSNRFIWLENITTSPFDMSASVSIPDPQDAGEVYALQPSTLDIVLQSWSLAATKGEYQKLDNMFLPTFIEQIYVGAGGSQTTLRVRTTARESAVQALGDWFGVTTDNDVVFVLKRVPRHENGWVDQAEGARNERLVDPMASGV